MNSTIHKFGYPHTLLREFEHWLVLLRPAQVTLGSLVIAAKSEATAFGQLAPEAFAELAAVIAVIETGLSAFVHYERINYMMLMMIDPHVHFHVLPRYAGSREWQGLTFTDGGWPGTPDLRMAIELAPDQTSGLKNEIKKCL